MPTFDPSLESAASAFGDIADPERLEILRALKRQYYEGLSYSALMEAADFDDSGRFDYHLKQLTDHFVKKEEGRYRLRSAGYEAMHLVQRGDLSLHPDTDQVTIDRYCQQCDVKVDAWYEDGMVFAVCWDCYTEVMRRPIPPRAVLDADIETILDVSSQFTLSRMAMSTRGICPNCGCRKERTIELDHRWDRFDYPATTDCRCGNWTYSTVGLAILTRSPVIAFLHERGLDVFERRWWRFPWTYHEKYATLLNEDPTRVRVDIEAGEDVLAVTVSNEFRILDVTIE